MFPDLQSSEVLSEIQDQHLIWDDLLYVGDGSPLHSENLGNVLRLQLVIKVLEEEMPR